MANPNAAQERIDKYLREVRAGLRGLSDAQASEIVEELRSHIRDRTEMEAEPTDTGVITALGKLGRPAELAAMYVAETIVARAERSFSPWLILGGIFRWAALSSAGLLMLLGSLVGYALAASFSISALMKPFAPDSVGLWRLAESADSFSLKLGPGSPPPGDELLGWWIVPLGLLIGAGLFLLTTRFGLWGLRRLRGMSPVRLR